MGARVSIQFKNEEETSAVLFSHWGGDKFPEEAKEYVKELKEEVKDNKGSSPLDRLEPQIVMVDFIRDLTTGMKRSSSNLYLGINENDGDNSDYGHFIIEL